ncbi:hypothetical protein Sliba_00700 [Streptomyces nigrescens]|uniref:Uncharacterized protein n=1 Tax=Streptomyces nigrescens TaxID=1920 RepID=A0A640T7A0_STRNI|nr:hypothetical protein Sliba_00700 [Streptomyces libani subsp. libani]
MEGIATMRPQPRHWSQVVHSLRDTYAEGAEAGVGAVPETRPLPLAAGDVVRSPPSGCGPSALLADDVSECFVE